ncbi:hypothetical protein Goshw_003055 [Gossypium schwendimanii]|uniref:RNase H type-1 domain-containing protein n=1 Tax=Gossypium schwendimanii TaxID=34291 RepID=A0A7J9MBA2_GOSSC|nr:hypothetical protein [Gossypium schwendimanii]
MDGWDTKRVFEIYGENMRDHICNIPIIHNGPDDQHIWFHNPNSVFSSKSAYSWLILKQGVEDDAKVTLERAAALSRDFQIFNLVEDPLLSRKTMTKAWQKLHQGVLKINFDASVQGKKVFYGLVAKDVDGFVHGGRMGFVDKELLIECVELLAMEESLNFSQLNNWKNLELESDCASLVNASIKGTNT